MLSVTESAVLLLCSLITELGPCSGSLNIFWEFVLCSARFRGKPARASSKPVQSQCRGLEAVIIAFSSSRQASAAFSQSDSCAQLQCLPVPSALTQPRGLSGKASAQAMPDLSATEAAVYDRQLRVWGVETQKRCSFDALMHSTSHTARHVLILVRPCRLNAARIVIVGCTGLAAEVRAVQAVSRARSTPVPEHRASCRWRRTSC